MTGTHKNRISVTAFSVDPFKGPHIFQKPKSQHAILCPFLLGACELITIFFVGGKVAKFMFKTSRATVQNSVIRATRRELVGP